MHGQLVELAAVGDGVEWGGGGVIASYVEHLAVNSISLTCSTQWKGASAKTATE